MISGPVGEGVCRRDEHWNQWTVKQVTFAEEDGHLFVLSF